MTISNPITISPQSKPEKTYFCLYLSFKRKLSPTNTVGPIHRNPKTEKLDADLSLFPYNGKRIQLSHKCFTSQPT